MASKKRRSKGNYILFSQITLKKLLFHEKKKERSDLGIMFDKKVKKRRKFYGNIIDVGLPTFTDRKMKYNKKRNRVEPQGKITGNFKELK